MEGDGIEFGRDNGHVFMRITLEGFRLKKKNKGGLRTSNPALAGLVGTYMVADEAEKDGWYFLAPQARRGRKAKVA